MTTIQKILYVIAVLAALVAAVYFAIEGGNYVYSFCYVAATGLLLFSKPKRKDK